MKNKLLAIFGMGAYILSIIAPEGLVLISGVATTLFLITATVRLWRVSNFSSLLLIGSFLLSFVLEAIKGSSTIDGSMLVLLINLTKVVSFFAFFRAVFILWRLDKIKIDNTISEEYSDRERERLENNLEESKRKLEILLKQKSDVEKEMLQIQSSANTINQPIESTFTLCSKHSISLALKNIDMLTKNNENDKRFYKSFRSLKCSREDLKRSFYFLKDCVYFCENEPLYNNSEFLSSMSGLEMQVVISYLDVDPNDIPNDIRENHNFGSKFEQMKNLGEKQLEELKLINWRSKEHWQFWAEKYGKTDILAQYCLDQANK
jgi:hypothetical protein